MNNGVKVLLGFLAGAGVGLGAGKLYFEKKYQKIADEEIESVKECYHKIQQQRDAKDEMAGKIFECTSEKPEEEYVSYETSEPDMVEVNAFDAAREAGKQAIAKMVYENATNVDTEHPQEDTAYEPYMISETEYYDTFDNYDKVVLHYYMNDGYLVNENDDVVELAHTIGVDAYDLLGHSDESELYFRNDRTGEDYEVVRLYSSYVDVESSAGM